MWKTSPWYWCPRTAGKPGFRHGWRSCRRHRTCGGRADRRTRRSARPYWKDVSPPLRRYAELLLGWDPSGKLTGVRTVEEAVEQSKDGAALLAVSWKGIPRVID